MKGVANSSYAVCSNKAFRVAAIRLALVDVTSPEHTNLNHILYSVWYLVYVRCALFVVTLHNTHTHIRVALRRMHDA